MTPSSTCLECGAALKPDASLCPACLLSAGAATLPLQPVSVGIPTLPCEFGDYRLLKKIGSGGMGIVYEAEQLSSGRRLALKVLNQSLDNEEQRQRFLREGRLAATIDHPNSVYVFGTEEIEGVPVIAMELAAGGTLRDELKRRGTMPVSDAVDAILGIIDGLEAAHARGVLHRDMKPSNCFLSGDGAAIVGDYGLSISQTNNLPDAEQLTRSGMVMGTPAFSPPEQLRAQPLDQRADIYSTGGTLFYLLTGKAPVERSSPIETVAAVLEGSIPNVRTLRPEVPEDLAAVIARCLATDATRRPENYAELRLALLPFSSQLPEPAPLGTRWAAGFIDSMVVLMLVFSVMAGLMAISTAWTEQNFAGIQSIWISILNLLIPLAFYILCESRWGATPGKWILGITVMDVRGGAPSWLQAMGRALIYLGVPTLGELIANRLLPLEAIGEMPSDFQLALAIGTMVLVFNLHLLLFIPALRRRDRAAWHDAVTRTRVVLARHVAGRMRASNMLPVESTETPQRWGPFEEVTALADGTRLAWDPVLCRTVMLTPRDNGSSPSVERRDCGRAGRLRWLQGVTDEAGSMWDAWQALPGAPLPSVIGKSPPTWQQTLSWLRDLSSELSAAEKDGTLPATLSLSQLWITTDGRAILLDHSWPGVSAEDDAILTKTSPAQAAQALLHRVVSLCPAVVRPMHGDALVNGLEAASFDRLSHVVGNVLHLLQQKQVVSIRSRAAALFAPILCTTGMLVFSMLMIQSFIESAWTTSYPGQPILPEVIKMYEHVNRPTTRDMPPGLKGQIRQHLAGHYASFFTKKAPPLSEAAILPERHRVVLRKILDSTTAPSTAELAIADEAVSAAVPRFQSLHPEHSGEINLAKGLPSTLFMVLTLLMLWQFVCILAVGSPLQMHLSGIAVVTEQERPATRVRMLWRWCIGWSVLLGIVSIQIVRAINGVDVIRGLPELSQAALPVILALALIGLLIPRRTLVDRLAGTWLVAR